MPTKVIRLLMGTALIVIGIVMIILGLATGIVSIIYGSKLLLKKDDIVF